MIRINLAPPSTKGTRGAVFTEGPGINLGLVFGTLFAALIGALGAWSWQTSSDIASLNEEITHNEREKIRLAAVIAEGQRVKRDKEELESRVNAIERIAQNQARPTYLLDAMAEVVPPELWLTRVEEKGRQLRLGGITYTPATLADFMANLRASGKFKDVDLVESRQDLAKSPRMLTFEVSCRFEI